MKDFYFIGCCNHTSLKPSDIYSHSNRKCFENSGKFRVQKAFHKAESKQPHISGFEIISFLLRLFVQGSGSWSASIMYTASLVCETSTPTRSWAYTHWHRHFSEPWDGRELRESWRESPAVLDGDTWPVRMQTLVIQLLWGGKPVMCDLGVQEL